MSEQGGVELRVEELENYCNAYCNNEELTLEGLQEKIAGIPPDAVRESDFFHWACATNERVTLEIVECLLDAFPDAARSTDAKGRSPLHYACENMNVDLGIVRLLLDRWPESVNHQDTWGFLPLHCLCRRLRGDDKAASLAILNLLLAAAPLSATIADGRNGDLPIHLAGLSGKPFPFCKRLIDADPETLRVQDGDGCLPIHFACAECNVEIVKYMIEQYPESIDTWGDGELPIHCAALSRDNSARKADIIRYLLAKDPECASKTGRTANRLPFHWVASEADSLESLRLLFDAYPEAIDIRDGIGNNPLDLARNPEVRGFLETQLAYARQAEDTTAMTTPDENGRLPLHRALWNGARLGAIKLLIAGNRDALQVSFNQSGAFPLHIACEFSTVGVVEYLLGLSGNHLHTVDLRKDSTLHYACRGGNVDVVKYLVEQHVPSVLEVNSDGKLPVHLLWESDRVVRDSVEYVEANWLLLLANPGTVMHCRGTHAPSRNVRRRLV